MTLNDTPTILIAEDEALMRERLLAQLAQAWPKARIVAVAENGNDAWDAWVEHEPDVVFLDIQMPGLTGLEVARRIAERSHVVFVTAYDQHALEALQRGAIDYLLKPVDIASLERAVARLKQRTQQAPAALGGVLAEIKLAKAPAQRLKWLKASVGKQIRLINVSEVLFLQSDTKYTRVVLADGEALIRVALKDLLEGLDPELFWQIHRGTIVNAHAIAAVERLDNERLQVLVKGSDEVLAVSRTFAHVFRD
ncbi:LytTR family DNA-binding domain-containing protein [Duganella sp. HH105]|uniref:LytR/AlgR family response regulator transcription factor n=1 Tax=Duganella sp. HH105 TaxID=1781067 RepID=UPI000877E691|nr:LytTR family DNA-binding domain-containing protein [Duganella sp. HH105]OEZ62053.1 transcriptional regulatory protein YehT [Duganella sp. HH105]